MRRERADTDLELSFTFSLVVLTRAFLAGSLLAAMRLGSNCYHVMSNSLFPDSYPASRIHCFLVFSFQLPFKLIRTCCQFAVDTFLFLTRAFEIQTDRLFLARRPGLVIVYKKEKTCRIVDFAFPVDHIIKESEKKNKYLHLAR